MQSENKGNKTSKRPRFMSPIIRNSNISKSYVLLQKADKYKEHRYLSAKLNGMPSSDQSLKRTMPSSDQSLKRTMPSSDQSLERTISRNKEKQPNVKHVKVASRVPQKESIVSKSPPKRKLYTFFEPLQSSDTTEVAENECMDREVKSTRERRFLIAPETKIKEAEVEDGINPLFTVNPWSDDQSRGQSKLQHHSENMDLHGPDLSAPKKTKTIQHSEKQKLTARQKRDIKLNVLQSIYKMKYELQVIKERREQLRGEKIKNGPLEE